MEEFFKIIGAILTIFAILIFGYVLGLDEVSGWCSRDGYWQHGQTRFICIEMKSYNQSDKH